MIFFSKVLHWCSSFHFAHTLWVNWVAGGWRIYFLFSFFCFFSLSSSIVRPRQLSWQCNDNVWNTTKSILYLFNYFFYSKTFALQRYLKFCTYANLFDCLMWNVECLRIFLCFAPKFDWKSEVQVRILIENRKYNSAFLIYIKNRENHFQVVLLFAICGVRLGLRTFVSILLLTFIGYRWMCDHGNCPDSVGKISKSWYSVANCIIRQTFFSSNPLPYSSANCRDTVATIWFLYFITMLVTI